MRIGARTVETGIRKGVERGRVTRSGSQETSSRTSKITAAGSGALSLQLRGLRLLGERARRNAAPGTFGENLTLSSFGDEQVRIGDRFGIGETLVEVTAPRIPCAVFATRMGEPDWVKRFADARRPGLYVRVLEPGEVAAGDAVERLGGAEGQPDA